MEKTENDEKPFWNGFSQSQKISGLYQNTDTDFPNFSQQIPVHAEEFENDKSRFENVDYSHCFETTDLNLQVIDSPHYNVDNRLKNIKQEVEVEAETSERFHQKDNVYVFQNSDIQDIENNVDGGMLIETIKIKEEIREHQGQTLEDKFCISQQKYDSNPEIFNLKTERNGFEIKIDNSELEFENSNIGENNCVNIKLNDLKSENVPTTCEKHYITLETRGLVINSHVSIEDNSHEGIDRNSNFENSLSTDNNCNLKSDLTKLNINIRASENGAIYFMSPKVNYNSTDCHSDDFHKFKKQGKNSSNVCPYACTICRTKFKLEIFLNKHMVVYETDRPHMTSKTSKSLTFCGSSLGALNDYNMCNVCGKELKNKQAHQKHMINKRTERQHQCDFCDKGFKTVTEIKTTRNLQQQMISQGTAKSHQCSVCDKGFKSVKSLSRHIAIHNTGRLHQCNVCGKGFKTGGNLRQHFAVHSTERPYQCSVCEKVFKTLQHLKEHVANHRTERLHQCSVCFKSFKAVGTLRKHMAVHVTERPHQCSVCDKGFKTEQNLQRHMTVHSTERRHPCSLCDKRFKTVNELRRHMIHHSTEKPHQCSVCGQKFKSLGGLKYHRNSHSID